MSETTRRRSRPAAVLPLALVSSLALGLTELSLDPLLRLIHCDNYKERHPGMVFIPELDFCGLPHVERLRSRDATVYFSLSIVLPIVLSGLYGRLLDTKGRKYVMLGAASMGAAGDLWLYLTASYGSLQSSWSIYFAALLKGLSGNLVALNAAQYAFVADVSSPRTRSFSLGLMWLISWLGGSLSGIISVILGAPLQHDLVANTFAAAIGAWALYVLHVLAVLPETSPQTVENLTLTALAAEGSSRGGEVAAITGRLSRLTSLTELCEPASLIFRHAILRWLSLVSFTIYFAAGALTLLVPYHDFVFGVDPNETGIIATCKNIASIVSIIFLLPFFSAVYRCLPSTRAQSTSQNEGISPTERTALLSEDSQRKSVRMAEVIVIQADQSTVAPAQQELLLCAAGLLLQLAGMIGTWRSQDWVEVAEAMLLFGLGGAAGPSLWSLITLAAPPSKIGRALAGFSALNVAATALRSPAFHVLFGATVETMPRFVWLFASGIFALGALVVCMLRSLDFHV